ncbi:MAG TPA: hypothetical protein DD473_01670 [Planctomycetaceae bacterium]|nr:hypothetical protein [Planctomycetaceae bacterium]|tara:strand:- start:804 stop:1157 length:354 start_codon:yes stop_codon:yes gene_type:complete
MPVTELLRRQFAAEEGSFLQLARCELTWDWNAFRILTTAMYDVAEDARRRDTIETWIAHGFWFCDTWIRDWTSHSDFPRPDKEAYDDAIELIHNLSYFLFTGESPYQDRTLEIKTKG